jgi:hypothetical protein
MTTSVIGGSEVIARQLPLFVNDTIGNANFGPRLISHSDDIIDFNGHKMTLEDAMKIGANDSEIRVSTSLLLKQIQASNPSLFFKRNTGFMSDIWNSITGSREARMIEFTMNCRRIERMVIKAPLVLQQARKGVYILLALEQIYERDIESLDVYIREGRAYISELSNGDVALTEQQEYGITRLEQRIINLEVTKASSEMNKVQVGMLLHSASFSLDLFKECVESAIPIWKHQVKQLKSGAAIADIDQEAVERLRTLVNKLNANAKKGK